MREVGRFGRWGLVLVVPGSAVVGAGACRRRGQGLPASAGIGPIPRGPAAVDTAEPNPAPHTPRHPPAGLHTRPGARMPAGDGTGPPPATVSSGRAAVPASSPSDIINLPPAGRRQQKCGRRRRWWLAVWGRVHGRPCSRARRRPPAGRALRAQHARLTCQLSSQLSQPSCWPQWPRATTPPRTCAPTPCWATRRPASRRRRAAWPCAKSHGMVRAQGGRQAWRGRRVHRCLRGRAASPRLGHQRPPPPLPLRLLWSHPRVRRRPLGRAGGRGRAAAQRCAVLSSVQGRGCPGRAREAAAAEATGRGQKEIGDQTAGKSV